MGEQTVMFEQEEDSEEFDPRCATYRLEMAFLEVFESWPGTTPLDELVEWLSIKHAMMKVEAERWNRPAADREVEHG